MKTGKSLGEIARILMMVKDCPTKEQFGKLMHDSSISEAEKIKVAKAVALAGGYECLLSE